MRDADELAGKALGAYTLIERIGAGGMASVYKAYQGSLRRYVAIKVLHKELADNQEFITRFRREAVAVAHLSHPNILYVHDAGVTEGLYYIAMDYIDGGSLKDLLRLGPLSVDQAVSIATQLADALDYAHRQGLVHRDVKPANVLMTQNGRPVLSDFGIAKVLYEVTSLTRTGTAIGTPDYMSPEQFLGGAVDGRTDVYALGIVLYEMIVGQPPFSAPTPMATLYKQANEPPAPLGQVTSPGTVPPWLEAAVSRALVKRPDQRYQRAGELADDLRRGQAAGTRPYVAPAAPYGPPAYGSPRDQATMAATGPAYAPPSGPAVHVRAGAATPPYAGRATDSTSAPSLPAPVSAPGVEDYGVREKASRSGTIAIEGKQSGSARRNPVPLLAGLVAVLFLALLAAVAYLVWGGAGQSPSTTVPSAIVVVVTSAPGELPTDVSVAVPTVATVEIDTPVPPATDAPPPTVTAEPSAPPTVEQPPTATAEQPPTIEPTRPPATRTPAPSLPAEPGVIADFETFGTWKRGDQPNGTFTQSNAQVHQGRYSGRLDYQFGTAGNDYVVFQQAHAIGGQPAGLSAWVYGDGTGHFLNAWIKDKAGQMWQVPFGMVGPAGWQQMTGRLDVTQSWPWTHISGPDNGAIDYPISFVGLVLDDRPDSFNGSGTIYIDELRADTAAGQPPAGPTDEPPAGATSAPPTAGPTAPPAAVSGRIAYSAAGALHIANAATGDDTISPVPNMRQPDFRADGQLIIANGDGGGQDSLWTVRASGGLDGEQSTHPDDYRPFFSPSNPGRFVYDSTMMGKGHHNLFVGNLNSRKEDRQPLSFGPGAIIGSHPVWLGDDRVVYTGCDYGFGSGGDCGLYVVGSWGGVPTRILAGGLTELATDAFGARILVTSQRDGNWELYGMNADGSGSRNLSNSAASNDGLGTFSPDGKLVAFVSDRGGQWAVWVIRPDGSGLAKLFNLPARLTGTWTEERISWAP